MYAVTATVETKTDNGWTGSRQIPTFYLDEKVQGIMDEEDAWVVANEILTNAGANHNQFHITVAKL